MNSNTENLATAGVIRRLSAMTYDALLVFGVLFTATLPTVLLDSNQQPTNKDNEQVVHDLPSLVDGWPFQIYLLVVYLSFFCWFWRRYGQTLGMQAWRLQVQDMNGGRITLVQSLKRIAGACISTACLGAGYWWVWIDKDNLSWHDHWSKTRVVILPKKKQ
jgi:uncharacterized RDD family membrane protein YckC